MGSFQIEYNYSWKNNCRASFRLEFDDQSMSLIGCSSSDLPEWAELDYYKCMNCTLDSETVRYCPASVSFIPVISAFRDVSPLDDMDVEVVFAERKIILKAKAQKVIGSIIGLLFAASGCPHTVCFRPMVRYHVPLSNDSETMMRAASMYTLAQYFRYNNGEKPDYNLKGLKKIYEELQVVNRTMAERLQAADGSSASINCLILLDMYAHTMPFEIDDSLKDLKYLFKSYLS